MSGSGIGIGRGSTTDGGFGAFDVEMRVTVVGPNLPRKLSDRGTFHIHAEGCADLSRGLIHPYARDAWTLGVHSVLDVVSEVYADQIAESDDDAETYVHDFHFAPCTDALPYGPAPRADSPPTGEPEFDEGQVTTGERGLNQSAAPGPYPADEPDEAHERPTDSDERVEGDPPLPAGPSPVDVEEWTRVNTERETHCRTRPAPPLYSPGISEEVAVYAHDLAARALARGDFPLEGPHMPLHRHVRACMNRAGCDPLRPTLDDESISEGIVRALNGHDPAPEVCGGTGAEDRCPTCAGDGTVIGYGPRDTCGTCRGSGYARDL